MEGAGVRGGCCKEITVYYGSLAKRSKGLSKAKTKQSKAHKNKSKVSNKSRKRSQPKQGGVDRVGVERKSALPGVANGILDGWECT